MPRRDADESEEVGLCARVVRQQFPSFLNSGHSVQWAQTPAKTGHACTVDPLLRCDGKGSLDEGDRSTGRRAAHDQQVSAERRPVRIRQLSEILSK